ncbi:MAG: polyprenol phosphomannose-dependent alpha 1,6 mannosyltransferase MptB [Micropruina sp.]|nr:polyprenol phosphomannose-dependent alpha 1,6 mannosyltransferase MptB [Micropruina sp.]
MPAHPQLSILASPAVWLGLLGSVLTALGELRGQQLLVGVIGAEFRVPLIVTGITALAVAWGLLRPRPGEGVNLVGVFVLWALPLLLLPPVLSTDAGSYADLGWMINQGFSPYEQGLGTTGSPFAYGRAWRGTTSVYPALSLELFAVVVKLTGAHAYWSVVALRSLAVAGAAMLLWSLPRIARRIGADPDRAVWLAVLNPITLIHGIGGEHIDLLMVGLVGVALAVALTPFGLVTGAMLIGVAAAVKQPALLAAPVVAGLAFLGKPRAWARDLGGAAFAVVIAVGAFVGVSELTGLGLGWLEGTGDPSRSATPTPAYLLTALADAVGLSASSDTLMLVGQGLSVLLIGGLYLRFGAGQPLRFLGVAALISVLGLGSLREWYLLAPLAFLGLSRPGRWVNAGVTLLVPLFAVYGCFREYLRLPIITSMLYASTLALAVVASISLVTWTRRERVPVR